MTQQAVEFDGLTNSDETYEPKSHVHLGGSRRRKLSFGETPNYDLDEAKKNKVDLNEDDAEFLTVDSDLASNADMSEADQSNAEEYRKFMQHLMTQGTSISAKVPEGWASLTFPAQNRIVFFNAIRVKTTKPDEEHFAWVKQVFMCFLRLFRMKINHSEWTHVKKSSKKAKK